MTSLASNLFGFDKRRLPYRWAVPTPTDLVGLFGALSSPAIWQRWHRREDPIPSFSRFAELLSASDSVHLLLGGRSGADALLSVYEIDAVAGSAKLGLLSLRDSQTTTAFAAAAGALTEMLELLSLRELLIVLSPHSDPLVRALCEEVETFEVLGAIPDYECVGARLNDVQLCRMDRRRWEEICDGRVRSIPGDTPLAAACGYLLAAQVPTDHSGDHESVGAALSPLERGVADLWARIGGLLAPDQVLDALTFADIRAATASGGLVGAV